ncbi:MAG: type II toxin-antitoxin system Phd/YefM family antitoxin [Curvibacter sp.]
MQTLLTELAVSMSEFKKNPAAVLRQAQGRPVAVLNHNKVDFYLLTPELLEGLLATTADTQETSPPTEVLRARLLRQAKAGPN